MARRNATRRSSCWAIESATRVASTSGLRTSTMLIATSALVMRLTSLRSFSMSAPFLPITTPGRPEWMVTRHFRCGRSMTIFETAACFSCFMRAARMATSSCISLAYSPLPANQRESQVLLIPSRKPIGLTFWPIRSSSRRFGGRDFANHDGEVREGLQDAGAAATRTGVETLQHERLADEGLGDDEIVDVQVVVVLSVRDRA